MRNGSLCLLGQEGPAKWDRLGRRADVRSSLILPSAPPPDSESDWHWAHKQRSSAFIVAPRPAPPGRGGVIRANEWYDELIIENAEQFCIRRLVNPHSNALALGMDCRCCLRKG